MLRNLRLLPRLASIRMICSRNTTGQNFQKNVFLITNYFFSLKSTRTDESTIIELEELKTS